MKMTIREWLQSNVDKYDSRRELVLACQEELNVSESCVYRAARKLFKEQQKPSDASRIDEFRKAHDKSYIVPTKVQAVVDSWLQDREWAYDSEMQAQCGIKNASDWKKFAKENEMFEHLILSAGGKLIWAKNEAYRDTLQELAFR